MNHNKLFGDIAAIFVSQAGAGAGLDYSEESLKRVDRLIAAMQEEGAELGESFVLSAGAYLGETTVRLLEGEWHQDADDLCDSSIVVHGCELWPFRRVRQRLHYGTARPLYAWYEMAKSAATDEIQKLLQTQEQATLIRPTGQDPLIIQVQKRRRDPQGD